MGKLRLRMFLPDCLVSPLKEIETKLEIRRWEKAGKPLPPVHSVKRMAIREYQQKQGLRTLVETGTYTGEMVFVQLHHFDSIHSIELSPYYYQKAVKRFRKYSKVHLHHGDSAVVLKEVVAGLKEPALFWLDGHYSGGMTAKGSVECPIFDELDALLDASRVSGHRHTILIDDAHSFTGSNDYPTIHALKQYLDHKAGNPTLTIKDNIIRIEQFSER